VSKKNKPKKDKKKGTISSLRYHDRRDPEPEIADSDDLDFWVPPVGNRWDDDDGQDR
jgi:hypothetical protein